VRVGTDEERLVALDRADDLAVQKVGSVVLRRRKCRRTAPAGAEVDRQPVRRRACAGVLGDLDDPADDEPELLEVVGRRRFFSLRSATPPRAS
jgi:hypothetical protein